MTRNTGRAIALSVLALLIGVGIAVVAYNAGLNHTGPVAGRAWTTPPNAQVVYVRPWGFGFGFFFPVLFILLFFGLIRAAFWGGRRRWHGYGYGYRCHEHGSPDEPGKTATTV